MAERPKGLPPPVTDDRPASVPVLDKLRSCPDCGNKTRTVSNYLGVRVHCAHCKKWWPVSAAPLRPEAPPSPQRGVRKETLVEPDWGKAFDDDPY